MIALPEKLSMPLLQVSRGPCFKIYLLSDENSAFFRKKRKNTITTYNAEKCTKKSSQDVLDMIFIRF